LIRASVLSLLLLAAAGRPSAAGLRHAVAAAAAQAGTVAGHARPGSVVYLAVPVAEVPPVAAVAALKLGLQNGRVLPRISAAQIGSSLQITLLDSVFSDLSVYFGLSELAFRRKFVVPGDVSKTTLARAGLMTIENENSPTDRAYIYVAPTPSFAVAGGDGRYRLEGAPPGKRRVTAWDETHGTQDRDVVVPAGGTVQLDFEIKK
jgi:hypothetical protein